MPTSTAPLPAYAPTTAGSQPTSAANTLGLDYAAEAQALPYAGPIIDIHTHVTSPQAAEVFLQAADDYRVTTVLTMTGFDAAKELHAQFSDRIQFICVPDFRRYMTDKDADVFVNRWLDDIRRFREELGSRVIKLWAAPRGRDFFEMADGVDAMRDDPNIGNPMLLDSPIRRRGLELALDLGYSVVMSHVGDPDTWFATKYADADRYGTKPDQFTPLRKLLNEHPDLPWIGAHMSGYPEDLDFVQQLLDDHPNYLVDTSACKWQVRELSKHPNALADFARCNPGRVLFGTDIVANADNVVPHEAPKPEPGKHIPPGIGVGHGYDLYASRFWALRVLFETTHHGPSPIVDPDLHMVDPSLPEDSTADLHGCGLAGDDLATVYHSAAEQLFASLGGI
ncbi:MAG: amidohydrolase family protein [Planctomycetota bacterium]